MLNTEQIPTEQPKANVNWNNTAFADILSGSKNNVEETQITRNVRASIRRGYPQVTQGPTRHERVCLVGSGPSLNETLDELRQLVWEGAILVTLNGAYQWCIDRGLQPKSTIIMDARPSNARFIQTPVPKCNYLLASQCDPKVWDMVEGREHVWIFHAVVSQGHPATMELDAYYQNQWVGVGGGTTVATRALSLLRSAGYLRYDLFGIDCCWLDGQHHGMEQPENDKDKPLRLTMGINNEKATPFVASPWHLKQFEDFMNTLKINGEKMLLHVHGRGMLAHAMKRLAASEDVTVTKEA